MNKEAQFDASYLQQLSSSLQDSAMAAQQDARRSNTAYDLAEHARLLERAGVTNPVNRAIQDLLLSSQPNNTGLVGPYQNTQFFEYAKSNGIPDRVVVNVGGFGAGGKGRVSDDAISASHVPRHKVLSYRWNDDAAIKRAIGLLEAGSVPRIVVGHSYGGDTVSRLAKEFPETKFMAVDPVGRSAEAGDAPSPENLSTYVPDNQNPLHSIANFAAFLGGRTHTGPDSQVHLYHGDHINGTDEPADEGYMSIQESKTKPGISANPEEKSIPTWAKQASFYDSAKEWAGYNWGKLLRDNPPSARDSAARAVAGAGMAATASLVADRIRKRKTRLRRLLLHSLIGASAGVARKYIGNYMHGKPYTNSQINFDKIRKGDKIYVGVSGAANGQDDSWFANRLQKHLPRGRVAMVNNGDSEMLDSVVSKITDKGGIPVVVGHSHGGKLAAGFLQQHPEISGYLIDPVSYTGRRHPDNTTIFTPDSSTAHERAVENFWADVGGRWNMSGPGTFTYRGGHDVGLDEIIKDFIAKGINRGNTPARLPDFITKSGMAHGRYVKKARATGDVVCRNILASNHQQNAMRKSTQRQ